MPTVLENLAGMIRSLMPIGKAWAWVRDHALFTAMAGEYNRVMGRVDDLITNLDPLTATDEDLLTDWERLLGLPDECGGLDPLISDRQQEARRKLSDQGGASANFFEEQSAALGFPDTIIRDILPFLVGRSRVGDRLTNPSYSQFRVGENRVGDTLTQWGWQFYFEANLLATEITQFRVGVNTVGQALVFFENPVLECNIRRTKPAHTGVYFTFREA